MVPNIPSIFQNDLVYKLPAQSILRHAPDMKLAAGDNRKQTAPETSSGRPVRWGGSSPRTASNTFKL